jgi:hypothetical protein
MLTTTIICVYIHVQYIVELIACELQMRPNFIPSPRSRECECVQHSIDLLRACVCKIKNNNNKNPTAKQKTANGTLLYKKK